jgi:very-short-patch-repair endonuclease/predicted transcriptional regulator of viral defense system
MAPAKVQPWSKELWELVRRQHGVVARTQLLALGLSGDAIAHRISIGRLHPLWRGVYAVGRPEVGRHGQLMAAALSCGPTALLSHGCAASLWEILPWEIGIDVVVPYRVARRRAGIRVHRRRGLDARHRHWVNGIPVTDPVSTLVDLACGGPHQRLERAIREADRIDLIDPVRLRKALDSTPQRPGLGRLRSLLDSETFVFTESELERRFLKLVRTSGLPLPKTQAWLNGFRVDFYWPDLGLVVETDGLRYHRTPSQQKKDRVRDHAHAVAGLTILRFTTAQVRFEPEQTIATLAAVASRLKSLR